MRPTMPLLAALALSCAAPEAAQTEKTMSSPAPATRPAPGQPAPDFTAAATSGGELGLSGYKGKQTLVLAFFPKAFTGG